MPIGLQSVNVGAAPGDNLGDPGRTAFQIVNSNSEIIEAAIEDAELKAFVVKCYAKDTVIEIGTAVEWWRQPYAFVLTEVRAACFLGQAGSDIEIDINAGGASILGGVPLVIPASTTTSVGHSPQPDVSAVILSDNALMTIDVDDVGSGATATGLEVTLIGYVIWVTS